MIFHFVQNILGIFPTTVEQNIIFASKIAICSAVLMNKGICDCTAIQPLVLIDQIYDSAHQGYLNKKI